MLEKGGEDGNGDFSGPIGGKYNLGICHDRRPIFRIARTAVPKKNVSFSSHSFPFPHPREPLTTWERRRGSGGASGERERKPAIPHCLAAEFLAWSAPGQGEALGD